MTMYCCWSSLLTGFWWRSRRSEGLVGQKILQVFHDLVGAVRVVPSVLLFIPSLTTKSEGRHIEMKRN